MTFTLVENVRGFFVSRPPLVVFMVCLASFAIALITFAYIVKIRDMPNPDITEDWNTFLQPLSEFDYCVLSEPGAAISNASQEATVPEQGIKDRLNQMTKQILSSDDEDSEGEGGLAAQSIKDHLKEVANQVLGNKQGGEVTPAAPTTAAATASASQVVNVSVLVDLELIPTTNLLHVSTRHNFTFITAALPGQRLGLPEGRKHLEANLTLVIPPLVNQSHQCQHGQCYKLRACATLTAPQQFFPHKPARSPELEESCVRDMDLGGENHFHLEVTTTYIHCTNASILTIRHQYDPTLTVMLTMQDRSVINLHLMHTSYFLFVMIVTLFCYALIKGRATKVKVIYTQCATESNAMNHA